ncbi:MAG: hypothetical protein MJZ68_08450 [archaeon]|nr:hypothetical protein [archaeon]
MDEGSRHHTIAYSGVIFAIIALMAVYIELDDGFMGLFRDNGLFPPTSWPSETLCALCVLPFVSVLLYLGGTRMKGLSVILLVASFTAMWIGLGDLIPHLVENLISTFSKNLGMDELSEPLNGFLKFLILILPVSAVATIVWQVHNDLRGSASRLLISGLSLGMTVMFASVLVDVLVDDVSSIGLATVGFLVTTPKGMDVDNFRTLLYLCVAMFVVGGLLTSSSALGRPARARFVVGALVTVATFFVFQQLWGLTPVAIPEYLVSYITSVLNQSPAPDAFLGCFHTSLLMSVSMLLSVLCMFAGLKGRDLYARNDRYTKSLRETDAALRDRINRNKLYERLNTPLKNGERACPDTLRGTPCVYLVPLTAIPDGTYILDDQAFKNIRDGLDEPGRLRTVEEEGDRIADAFLLHCFCMDRNPETPIKFLETYGRGGKTFTELLELAYLVDPKVLRTFSTHCLRRSKDSVNPVLWAIYYILSEHYDPEDMDLLDRRKGIGKVLSMKLPSENTAGIHTMSGLERTGCELRKAIRDQVVWKRVRSETGLEDVLDVCERFGEEGMDIPEETRKDISDMTMAMIDGLKDKGDLDGLLRNRGLFERAEDITGTSFDLRNAALETAQEILDRTGTPDEFEKAYLKISTYRLPDEMGIMPGSIHVLLLRNVSARIEDEDDITLKSAYYDVIPHEVLNDRAYRKTLERIRRNLR